MFLDSLSNMFKMIVGFLAFSVSYGTIKKK